MLAVAAAAAAASPLVGSVVVTAPAGWEDRARGCVEGVGCPAEVVTGGTTRQEHRCAPRSRCCHRLRVVAVHDAARPFAPPDLFTAVIDCVSDETPGVVPVVAVADTVKRIDAGRVVGTVDRARLGLAQTPQAFDVVVLRAAHDRPPSSGAGAHRRRGGPRVGRCRGPGGRRRPDQREDHDPAAISRTPTPAWAASMAERVPRVGIGFDVHPWASEDRALWLGGVRFDGERRARRAFRRRRGVSRARRRAAGRRRAR